MKKVLLVSLGLIILLAMVPLALGGCASKPSQTAAITVWLSPSAAVPWVVAQKEGFFTQQGVNIDARPTEEDQGPFLAKQTPLDSVSSWEAGQYRLDKEDVMIFGLAGGVRFFNGIAVKKSNYPKPYGTVPDLKGKKLGNPGFGTGAWQAFVALSKARWNLDATKDFQNTSTSSGAMLALVDKGDLDGCLLYSGQTLAAVATGFPLIFSFDKEWEAFTGSPLFITLNVARTSWLKQNPDTARKINTALDMAVNYLAANPKELDVGGKYEVNARDAGYLATPEVIKLVQEWVSKKSLWVNQSAYTDAFIASAQKFNQLVMGDKTPAQADLFWSPAEANKK